MQKFDFSFDRPGLLVSVRSADEARAALAGGAQVIDVKEPSRGSLGAPDSQTVEAVVAAVGERVPISVAVGELLEVTHRAAAVPGVAFVKIGLSGCRSLPDWADRWQAFVDRLPAPFRPVAVVYADWEEAGAPAPDVVLAAAIAIRCPALLVDTWSKSGGTLFDHWSAQDLALFCGRVRAARIGVVLAGSLQGDSLGDAAACRPDLIAVRGGACDGGRMGRISESRVRTILATIRTESAARGDKLLSPPADQNAAITVGEAGTRSGPEFS